MKCDLLIDNVKVATMAGGREPYGLIDDGAIAVDDGAILQVGKRHSPANIEAGRVIDGRGMLATPGLIDCHTHIVYGGNRANEFEQRLTGVSYEEIARRGGGIVSTVKATRAATADELLADAGRRVRSLMGEGVTTLEAKTGYGLDPENESKMVRVMEMLERDLPVDLSKTFLGAHAVPPELSGRPDDYIRIVIEDMLPLVADRVDAVDVFCETIAFDLDQTQRVFAAARKHNLPLKIHAEQLSNMGAAAMAASMGALSADHLEHIDERGVRALAANGTTAVLLPGAFYFLREKQLPPVDLFRRDRVPMAVATDCNPGSSPCLSILTILNMACTLFRLSPEEALAGVTINAARALGIHSTAGSIEAGKKADLVLWDVDPPAELSYYLGHNPCRTVIKNGTVVISDGVIG